MTSRILLAALLFAPFMLAACGEGWEAQLTNTHFPYGNARTAGSGVIYVRAQLLPKKELKLEDTQAKKDAPKVAEPAPVKVDHPPAPKADSSKEMEKVFAKSQKK